FCCSSLFSSFYFCCCCECSKFVLRYFPTRRSSDLLLTKPLQFAKASFTRFGRFRRIKRVTQTLHEFLALLWAERLNLFQHFRDRSEEHTSELQSRENLVCRLLLEKKKNDHKHVLAL